jgi:predicted RNA-binding protein
MQQGDYIIYYSHKLSFGSSEPCQKFTAVGQVLGEEIFTYEPEPGSVFYRRRARYFPSTEASVRPLIEKLEFIRNKKQWGAPFRYGLLQISKQDFEIIAAAMGVDLTALQTSNLNL